MVEYRSAFLLIQAQQYYCTFNRTFFMKQNVTEKRPIFDGASLLSHRRRKGRKFKKITGHYGFRQRNEL